jgi:hypothetical protein
MGSIKILTKFKFFLSELLGFNNPLQYIGLPLPARLIPVVDYHQTMHEYTESNIYTAGNITTYIIAPKKHKTRIYTGHIKLICDANVANRYIVLEHCLGNETLHGQVSDAIIANETKAAYLNAEKETALNASNKINDFTSATYMIYPMYYKLYVTNGLAGDIIDPEYVQETIPTNRIEI